MAIVYASTTGLNFTVDPVFLDAIAALIASVRAELKAAQQKGQFVAYLSVPVSPRGGGHFGTNNAIAAATASAVEGRFGSALKVLNPAAYSLPAVGNRNAGGGEYMAVWADVLGGVDGTGGDFDMVYFVGPHDVWSFFAADPPDTIGAISRWIEQKSNADPDFKRYIDTGDNRRQFLRYYALRGSAEYSKGGHDEWNIVTALNSKRPTGDDIAVYFDGDPIEPGDYDDGTDPGYQAGRS